jgi:hypothetical protein
MIQVYLSDFKDAAWGMPGEYGYKKSVGKIVNK